MFEKYLDLSLRLISDTTLEDIEPISDTTLEGIEPMRIERSGSKKNLNNNLTYFSIQQNIELAIILLLQRIQVFTMLEAPYI